MVVCTTTECSRRALFGTTGTGIVRCSGHKLEGEINLKCKMCVSEGCTAQAYFGTVHQKPMRCGEHRLENERNVVMKECAANDCHVRATCGEIGGKPTHCRKHCSPTAVFRVIKTCNASTACHRARCYGKVGERPMHCGHHRKPDEIDVVSPRCETEACSVYDQGDRPVSSHTGTSGARMCSHCYRSIHPDLNRLRVRVEHFVLAEIQRLIPQMTKYLEIQDCPVPCGVSMERPDALYVIGKTLVQIEIDETPDHENDQNRLMRILASTNAVEHIVIRVHTHSTDQYPSMFTKKRLRNGESVLEARPAEFGRRMTIIQETIRGCLEENKSCVKILFTT